MKLIKHNGFTLPNVGACVEGVKEEDKHEFLRLIQKASKCNFFMDWKYYGIPDNHNEFANILVGWDQQQHASAHYTILPILEAITWLKIGVGEITKDNWMVDIKKEKDHSRLAEFKEWYQNSNIKFKYNWVSNYYGKINGICIDPLYPEHYGIPLITLDQFFAYFYEEQESTERQPVKGDLVEVSDDGINWYKYNDFYTGYTSSSEGNLCHTPDTRRCNFWKYVRLPKPQPTPRELAEKKACELSDDFPALVEYILQMEFKK